MVSYTLNQQLVDEHVFLVGRPPLGEFIGFVTSLALQEQATDHGALADEWRSANDHIRSWKTKKQVGPDNPGIAEIPASLTPLQESVYEDPIYQRSFSIVPASIGMVELDRLVVYQKHINLEYVRRIQADFSERSFRGDDFLHLSPF
ncbi:MAG: hypothetical protein M5U34_45330 [Chloroflexi bacterium]|nr:hypothetical protein [Chloroflexota bacterium]